MIVAFQRFTNVFVLLLLPIIKLIEVIQFYFNILKLSYLISKKIWNDKKKIEWIDKIERKNVTWKHTIIIEKCKHLKKNWSKEWFYYK
jgi:hypothetical protein